MPTSSLIASPSDNPACVGDLAADAASTALETIDAIDDALRQGVHGLIADLADVADVALKPALRIRIIKALLDLRKLLLAPASAASFKPAQRRDEPTPEASSAKSPAPAPAPAPVPVPVQALARDETPQRETHSSSAASAPPTPPTSGALPPKLSSPKSSPHRTGAKRDPVVLNAEQLSTVTEFLPCLLSIGRADPRAATLLESSGVCPAIPSLPAR